MQFLYPGFLWALAALSIPIILHLFYFRRYKKIYFTNVRFLREVKEETSARNKLRNLLILLMRLLAVAFLVFAFAQPFISSDDEVKLGKKTVSIFVDNSFSMNAFTQDLPLVDKAKQKAREVVDAYSTEDEFQILTHDLSAKQQRILSKDDAITAIEEIEISPAVSDIDQVLNWQDQGFAKSVDNHAISYLISDFQRNILSDDIELDTNVNYNFIPLRSVQEKNIAIDSAWFDSPVQMLNQTNSLLIRIRNYSNEDVENVKVSLELDGTEKPVGTISLKAGEEKLDTANITLLKTGWHKVLVRITDFPVQFDDQYYMTFYVDEDVKVLAINQNSPNRNLEAVFTNNSYFNLDNQSLGGLNFSAFPEYDLIVVDELNTISSGLTAELRKYVDAGGKVLFFPRSKLPVSTYNDFLGRMGANIFESYVEEEQKVSNINTQEFIFNNVFERITSNVRLPAALEYYKMSRFQGRSEQRLMTFRNGDSYLSKYPIGTGQFVVCAAGLDPEVNDLAKNAEVFVPLLYKLAISSGSTDPYAYTIGEENLIEIDKAQYSSDEVMNMSGATDFIPGVYPSANRILVDVNDQISEAGYYDLEKEDQLVGIFAFNYNRQESDLSCLSSDDLKSTFQDVATIWDNTAYANFSQLIGEKERGIILWKWCIIFALVFLAIEVLIIRFWKA